MMITLVQRPRPYFERGELRTRRKRRLPQKQCPDLVCALQKTTRELVSRRARTGVENLIQLVTNTNVDVGERCRLVKRIESCKGMLESSSDEQLAREKYTKEFAIGDAAHWRL